MSPYTQKELEDLLVPKCVHKALRDYLGASAPIAAERIIFNPPATIVFWTDGTKTVVKAMDGTEFNEYFGFCAALAKKIFGSNNAIHKTIIRKGTLSKH